MVNVQPDVLVVTVPTPQSEGLVVIYPSETAAVGTHYIARSVMNGVEFRKLASEGGETYLTHHSRGVPQKCTCPDAKYRRRPGGCKHQLALAALLAKW